MTPEERRARWNKCREKRLAEMKANPYDRAHGTVTGYKYGCRCPYCGFAESEYKRKFYKRHSTRMKKAARDYYKAHKAEINAKWREQYRQDAVKRWSAC